MIKLNKKHLEAFKAGEYFSRGGITVDARKSTVEGIGTSRSIAVGDYGLYVEYTERFGEEYKAKGGSFWTIASRSGSLLGYLPTLNKFFTAMDVNILVAESGGNVSISIDGKECYLAPPHGTIWICDTPTDNGRRIDHYAA